MRAFFFLFAALFTLIPTGFAATYEPRIVAAADAGRDVALLRRALETIHPGLYRYTARPEIEAAFARLERAAKRPISELTLQGEIALMLAAIHCDHTKVEASEAFRRFRETAPTHLPLRFQMIEGRMVVVSSDFQQGAPPVGAEILSINGMAVPRLLTTLGRAVSYDGTTDQAVAAKLADDGDLMGDAFNENYPSFFGVPEQWRIDWKRPGAADRTTVVLHPIPFPAWVDLKGPGARYRSEFYNSVTWRMSGKTARVRIDTFVNYRNPVQASAFLGGFFKAMEEAGTEHLILDLRNNGGGSDDVSIALGRHLLPGPFVWSKPIRYKTVRFGDLAQFIETWGDRDARFNPPLADFTKTADGWYERIPVARGPTISDADTTLPQQPVAEGRFTGRLTILSGPRNGSGATRTIAQLKEKAGATVVGEDSGGSAEGPTAGSIFLLKLPASGLKVRIPEAWNRTNIARWEPGKGVAVDQLVVPTLADFEAGRDRTLDVARGAAPTVEDAAALAVRMLAGRWTGTLDTREYGDDGRVTLPTLLSTHDTASGQRLDWTYDDGPGKTVLASEGISFDASGRTATISGDNGARDWRVVEARVSGTDGAATLVLDADILDGGRPASARLIHTLEGDRLRITKLTRTPGTPFLLRSAYDLRRRP